MNFWRQILKTLTVRKVLLCVLRTSVIISCCVSCVSWVPQILSTKLTRSSNWVANVGQWIYSTVCCLYNAVLNLNTHIVNWRIINNLINKHLSLMRPIVCTIVRPYNAQNCQCAYSIIALSVCLSFCPSFSQLAICIHHCAHGTVTYCWVVRHDLQYANTHTHTRTRTQTHTCNE